MNISPNVHSKNSIANTFASFHLGESEFAISVENVQEVVCPPNSYTLLPLAPHYLKGLFDLRGSIVPVVDLKSLLKYESSKQHENNRVAILELEGACVGLLFDKTGEIFREHEGERNVFNNEPSDSVVSGVFKRGADKHIVQILDVARLFKLKNIPKDSSHHRSQHLLKRNRGQRSQCISFLVGPSKCALSISDIQEILKVDKINDSSLGTAHCIGTIDIRGSTIPVVDFSALLGFREADRSPHSTAGERRVVVMRLKEELFGLLVDSVDSIISFYSDELLEFPVIEQSRADMFLGCIPRPNETDILLLNFEKILSNDEVIEITHGHSSLYHKNKDDLTQQTLKNSIKKTYLTFTIDNSYAVAINEVKEIIEHPKSLLKPPGLPKHVKGVLNLRGELVTLIDARTMYATQERDENNKSGKVIIFKRNSFHFGLLVDTVESLVSFGETDKVKLPDIFYQNGCMKEDVLEAVEISNEKGIAQQLLILCPDAIAKRSQTSQVSTLKTEPTP